MDRELQEWCPIYIEWIVKLKSIWSVILVFYLIMVSEQRGGVDVSSRGIGRFQAWMLQRGVTAPSLRTMRAATKELLTHGLLIRPSRGRYTINRQMLRRTVQEQGEIQRNYSGEGNQRGSDRTAGG